MLKPIPPRDADSRSDARDLAKAGYDLRHLASLLQDMDGQPDWRPRADLNVSYYDSRGIVDDKRRQKALAADLEPEAPNLVARVINSVLGTEAKSRSDVRVEADSGDLGDVCDVLNAAMKEAGREAYVDMAISNAYGSMVKAGIGWVEVAREQDPLAYPYRVQDVHRNEMWYDMRAQHFLLRDARWQVRKRWYDVDILQAAMPKFAQVFEQACNNWGGFLFNGQFDDTEILKTAWNDDREFRVRRAEWCDTARKRIKLFEVWYKAPADCVVLQLGPTRRVLYNEKNPLHVEAVARGLVKVIKGVTDQIRMALFAGPYRIIDIGTNKRNFPYIPFIAFRDDEDRSPYGLIDGMRIPQNDYTDRYLRVKWMLQARQVMVDNDALDPVYNSLEDLGGGAMRPDLVLVLDAERRNADAVKIGNSMQLQKEQFEAMDRAERQVQDVPGVYSSQLGNATSGVTSGLAINSLVEQGMVSMGEMNDNYRNARRAVHEAILELIVEDHSDPNLSVQVGEGEARRTVILNTVDAQGRPVNMVADAPVRVGLMDVPASPALKMQQMQQLSQVIGALQSNPKAIEVLTPAFIEMTSLDAETRRQAIEDLRRISGMPASGDRAAREEAGKQQAAAAAQQQALQKKAMDIKLVGEQAKANLDDARRELTLAQASLATMQAAQAVDTLVRPVQDDIDDEDALIEQALARASGQPPPQRQPMQQGA